MSTLQSLSLIHVYVCVCVAFVAFVAFVDTQSCQIQVYPMILAKSLKTGLNPGFNDLLKKWEYQSNKDTKLVFFCTGNGAIKSSCREFMTLTARPIRLPDLTSLCNVQCFKFG